jgi:hypothetical protein
MAAKGADERRREGGFASVMEAFRGEFAKAGDYRMYTGQADERGAVNAGRQPGTLPTWEDLS